MKQQATKATRAQIERTIKRQRAGLGAEFAHRHPLADFAGAALLAVSIGGMVAYWIKTGAGL